MSFEINWNKLPSSGQKKQFTKTKKPLKEGQRPLNFIQFTGDSVHIVRPIGKAHGYWRFYYAPAKKYINAKVVMDKDGKEIESNLEELKELLDLEPELRFAMNVIDRADNQIKIMQGPISILDDFAEIAQEKQCKPGGKGGGDWKITSTGEKVTRRYKCRYLGPQPFSEEELMRIQNPDPKKNEWYILEDVYRPSDIEWVKRLVANNKGNSTGTQPAQTKTINTTPVVTQEIDSADSVVVANEEDLEF
jgi:hypothetical protein